MKTLFACVSALPILALATPALAASGNQRLSGACVVDVGDGDVRVESFELDDVTIPTYFRHLGTVGIEFLFARVEFEHIGRNEYRARFETHLHHPWNGPGLPTSEETFVLEAGDTVQFADVADDYSVHCEATLLEAPTTWLELVNGDVISVMAETPRVSVGLPLPNQWSCGARLFFPLENRSGLIRELIDSLEITSSFPGSTVDVEVQEYQGTVTITTDTTAWHEYIHLEPRDHRTSIADAIIERVYPNATTTPPVTVEMLTCPDSL